MGSTLTVDNIVGATTAANVKLPAGSILQSVTKTFADTTSITSSGATFTDLTNATITITPKYNNSKILIIPNIAFYITVSGAYIYGGFRLLRGSSTVVSAANSRDGNGAFDYGMGVASNSTTLQFDTRHCAHDVDTPATTSAVTYKYQAQNYSSGRTIYINGYSASSSIIAMEISV